jgi:hypothetical protein
LLTLKRAYALLPWGACYQSPFRASTDVREVTLAARKSTAVTERRHGPKIGRGVRGRIADTVGAVHVGDTRGVKAGLPAPRML